MLTSLERLLLATNLLLTIVVLAVALALLLRRRSEANLATRSDVERSERTAREGVAELRRAVADEAKGLRQETTLALRTNEQRLGDIRETVDVRLRLLQEDNARKLEQMRATVDEKLESTLDRRLGESFRLVSDRLDQVHRGLGEMQALADGVGDLRRMLTNVKTRGIWGELQLAALLEQLLTPEQYAANVCTRGEGREVVEFAIRLPGGGAPDDVVWLPIDSKFPVEDYLRLVGAQEAADRDAALAAAQALDARVRLCARDIRDKYIGPPRTTDFAILFLPIEGLYAEVLRRPGLVETLQREFRVSVAGPSTLGAFLNSLRMGFRTLAIQRRSSEVWSVLGTVKTEFSTFGAVLDRVARKLEETTSVVEHASRRSRRIEKTLRGIEALPVTEALLDADGVEATVHPRTVDSGTAQPGTV